MGGGEGVGYGEGRARGWRAFGAAGCVAPPPLSDCPRSTRPGPSPRAHAAPRARGRLGAQQRYRSSSRACERELQSSPGALALSR